MVRSHRESVRRSVVAENLRHCVTRYGFCNSRGALQHRQKQQGPNTTATCYVVSVSQALEVEAVEGFYVEVKIYRIEVLFVGIPRTQFTAF